MVFGARLLSTAALVAGLAIAPAAHAERWHGDYHHHGGGGAAGAAIIGGLVGLGVGAAIAASGLGAILAISSNARRDAVSARGRDVPHGQPPGAGQECGGTGGKPYQGAARTVAHHSGRGTAMESIRRGHAR